MSTNARQARAVLAKLDARVKAGYARGIDRANAILVREIRVGLIVVSGRTAATLHATRVGLIGIVSIGGSGTDPAALEYGTSRQRPHPFMRPAITRAVPSMTSTIVTLARSALK